MSLAEVQKIIGAHEETTRNKLSKADESHLRVQKALIAR